MNISIKKIKKTLYYYGLCMLVVMTERHQKMKKRCDFKRTCRYSLNSWEEYWW